MTDKSICRRCAELIRVRVKGIGKAPAEEEKVCSIDSMINIVLDDDTVLECSRFVEVPGEETTVAAEAMKRGMTRGGG